MESSGNGYIVRDLAKFGQLANAMSSAARQVDRAATRFQQSQAGVATRFGSSAAQQEFQAASEAVDTLLRNISATLSAFADRARRAEAVYRAADQAGASDLSSPLTSETP